MPLSPPAHGQTLPHPGPANLTSIPEAEARIAWYDSICSGYALGYAQATNADPAPALAEIPSLAAETGAEASALRDLALRRAAEFAVVLEIVLGSPDPSRNPPQPFADLLRSGQADCQEAERQRRALSLARTNGSLSQTAPVPRFRPALRPDPDMLYRAQRVEVILSAMLDAMAKGQPISAEVLRVFSVYTDDAPLPEALHPDMADPLDALAYELIRDAAPVVVDITRAELVAVVAHIMETAEPFYRPHYFALFAANTPFGARDLITGPRRSGAPVPTPEEIVAEAFRRE